MSYCGPRWVSLFVYGRLTNNAGLDPVRACVDRPWWRDEILIERQLIPEKWLPNPPPEPPWLERVVTPQPIISIIGVLHGPDELEVQSVFRLDAESEVSNGRALDMRAELVRRGRVVASGPSTRCSPMPMAAAGAGRGRAPTRGWSRRSCRTSSPAPCCGSRAAERRSGAVRPRSAARRSATRSPSSRRARSISAGRSTRAASTSRSAGPSGRPIAAGPGMPSARACAAARPSDARGLPAGKVSIRLLMSDGFHTATSRMIPVTVPARPPEGASSARARARRSRPGPMRLWGAATDGAGEARAGRRGALGGRRRRGPESGSTCSSGRPEARRAPRHAAHARSRAAC